MIQLVCIDVDGTLVGAAGTVHPRVWPAAAALRARGVHLALCTGRPALGVARELATTLDADGWHIFQNGASVLHLPTGASRSRPLPDAAVAWLVASAGRTGRVLELYGDAGYVCERDDERARRHAALLGVPFALGSFAQVSHPVVRGQWMLPIGEVPLVLAEPHAGVTLTPSASPMMPDTGFVSVTPAGVDKAAAVRTLAAACDIPLAHVMMVGDGANDATAMALVGLAVAMGNAEPEALAAARIAVAHVDDGGLADALELALVA